MEMTGLGYLVGLRVSEQITVLTHFWFMLPCRQDTCLCLRVLLGTVTGTSKVGHIRYIQYNCNATTRESFQDLSSAQNLN